MKAPDWALAAVGGRGSGTAAVIGWHETTMPDGSVVRHVAYWEEPPFGEPYARHYTFGITVDGKRSSGAGGSI